MAARTVTLLRSERRSPAEQRRLKSFLFTMPNSKNLNELCLKSVLSARKFFLKSMMRRLSPKRNWTVSKPAMPADLYQTVTEAAAKQNVSVETLVAGAGAVADQLRIWERFESMASRATRESFLDAMNHVPDMEPEEFDR